MLRHFWVIYLLGAAGIWKSIPTGFLLNISPVNICLFTILGAFSAVLLIYLLGSRVKVYISKRLHKSGMKKKSDRLENLFEKYGALGVGLLGTVIIGPNMTMALGLAVIKSERAILAWTLAGTALWSVVLTVLGSYGISMLESL
jgi:membrane protein DedA with SNARE-associated domain